MYIHQAICKFTIAEIVLVECGVILADDNWICAQTSSLNSAGHFHQGQTTAVLVSLDGSQQIMFLSLTLYMSKVPSSMHKPWLNQTDNRGDRFFRCQLFDISDLFQSWTYMHLCCQIPKLSDQHVCIPICLFSPCISFSVWNLFWSKLSTEGQVTLKGSSEVFFAKKKDISQQKSRTKSGCLFRSRNFSTNFKTTNQFPAMWYCSFLVHFYGL